eukprot:gene31946-41440_t
MVSFSDDSKWEDGRMWLPLHFVVSLPNVDIQTISADQPKAIKAHTATPRQYNPCHLAVITKNHQLEVLRRLKVYYPRFGSLRIASDRLWMQMGILETPLHTAVISSTSVAMVRELFQLYPPAREERDEVGRTPLGVIGYADDAE